MYTHLDNTMSFDFGDAGMDGNVQPTADWTGTTMFNSRFEYVHLVFSVIKGSLRTVLPPRGVYFYFLGEHQDN